MLAIIVPYRDRKDHLDQFLIHMKEYYHYLYCPEVTIVEQADNKPFNRAKLLNIGFLNSEQKYFAFHDVDKLPVFANYTPPKEVRQICRSNIQAIEYLGGVTIFTREAFVKMEGYNNDFWGWGGEDNEAMFQIRRKGIDVEWKFGEFIELFHPRTGPEFIPELWQKAQLPRTKNMLNTCEYQLISKEVHDTHIHLRVLL